MIFLLFLGSLSALASPYLQDCGTYRAVGRAICKGKSCEFVVWEKSQAETRFKPSPEDLSGPLGLPGFATATLEVRSLDSSPFLARILEMNPLNGAPSMGAGDLKLLKKANCEKR